MTRNTRLFLTALLVIVFAVALAGYYEVKMETVKSANSARTTKTCTCLNVNSLSWDILLNPSLNQALDRYFFTPAIR